MNFAEVAKRESAFTRTENGAVALNTTSNPLLDLFGLIGSVRGQDPTRICTLFEEAYKADPLFATKIVFYARDIRGGLGERDVPRMLMNYMAKHHKEAVLANIGLFAEYGRYDDLYCLIDTPCEDAMWAAMKEQLLVDLESLHAGKPVSLLAKWIATADASSKRTRQLGILTAQKLGYSVYNFKRIIRALRKQINIVETKMSANRWGEIEYPAVPSRAMMVYRKAFMKHDAKRYGQFIQKAVDGEEKIHSATLYPYDIVEKVMDMSWYCCRIREDDVLEAQWRQLPDYVEKGTNALVIADTSGSMRGRPLATSVGLAVYFAERNTGPYHNMFMSFSGTSRTHTLKGKTLAQKIGSIYMDDWQQNTNLQAAFEHVLEIAVRNHVPPEEMPKSLIVVSDMEIDECSTKNWFFYDVLSNRFAACGYQIPNIVFWNVASRHNTFHADSTRNGVQLCSGQSASVFKQMLSCVEMTPAEAMAKVIGSERYMPIRIGLMSA